VFCEAMDRIIVPTMPKTCLVLSQTQQSPWLWPIAISLLTGMVMGCSGPDTLTGVDLGCLAWVGLVPLLAWIYCQITCEQPGFGARFGRMVLVSGAFGLGYHLVFGRWLLDVHPMTWLGFSLLQSRLLSIGALAVYVGVAALYWMAWAALIAAIGKVLDILYVRPVARIVWPIVVALMWLLVWGAYDTNPLGMPWASLTVSMAPHDWFRTWLGLLGSPTMTWLMIATQAWAASMLWPLSRELLNHHQYRFCQARSCLDELPGDWPKPFGIGRFFVANRSLYQAFAWARVRTTFAGRYYPGASAH
jgi:hypothetical protein